VPLTANEPVLQSHILCASFLKCNCVAISLAECRCVGLRHYATSRNVAGASSDEENDFFSIYLMLPATLGPGVYSASKINYYQSRKIMFLGSRERPVCTADNLSSICEPIV
jgi:hypothetical protein